MEYTIHQMAAEVGEPVKGSYTLTEVAHITGVPRASLDKAVRRGDLQTFVIPGMVRGHRVRPQWFEEWWQAGVCQ